MPPRYMQGYSRFLSYLNGQICQSGFQIFFICVFNLSIKKYFTGPFIVAISYSAFMNIFIQLFTRNMFPEIYPNLL